MTDLIEDAHDGFLVIPGEAESLAAAIMKLCQDPDLRRRLGSAGQEKMRRYTWSQSARRHELVFKRALGLKPEDAPGGGVREIKSAHTDELKGHSGA